MNVLVIAEHDRGTLAPATLEALAAARPLGTVHVATLGDVADGLVEVLAAHGAAHVHQVHHPLLADYGPEAWGDAVAQLVWSLNPEVVLACGTERVERAAGVTLATSPVVVGGGRGVGSPEGFGPLEELAGLLGGVVGCSRAVTNNGWRNHTDQVGQTGTRIAPDLYFACGISGAIQHWVGAMASKKILAINTDAEANMVTKADYAVIGDLHQVIPAISAEIRRRRG